MSVDLKGIENINEYYTNHYFATLFEENESDTLTKWRNTSKESENKAPWSLLRDAARQYSVAHERFLRVQYDVQTLINIRDLADKYLNALGYPQSHIEKVMIDEDTTVPVYLEIKKGNGAPLLWVLLAAAPDPNVSILEKNIFDPETIDDIDTLLVPQELISKMDNEDLATKILFGMDEPPRFLIMIGLNQIALIDRNKWNEKRYLQFDLDDIFGRREETTLQAMSVLLHKDSLCPDEGNVLLDEFDESSQRNASGVSQDLKYALRESIELLGNEVLYDMKTRQMRNIITDPVDASKLSLECLRYMYRMLFVLFIESRPDLGYAPMKSQVYFSAYSLESLRDIAEKARDDIDEVGESYYLFETLEKLYDLIYRGYPYTEEEQQNYEKEESHHDEFCIPPLKAHIFDPDRTAMITHSKIRNHVMLRIIDLMSVTRGNGKKGSRGRISYSNLGINQMGAVYEALLSYRGFIAENDLYEVKQAGSKFDLLEVGYFVSESDLNQYTEEERVYTKDENGRKALRMYKQGTFIYRLAGRERETSASYYTPECLTKCLVKYALKELLKDKTADQILELNICEPAMGSAAFLNEAIDQLSEAYLDKKQKERGETISYEKRQEELQKVKMYIADRNVYGIDLNPTAVELAEVSLWLNTIYDGGFVPWFGTQLINGNSLIGARKQCYTVAQIQASSKGFRWYELAPERVPLGTNRRDKNFQMQNRQVYHFLLGDPGMSEYDDKVIKKLEPDNIKKIDNWRKEFTKSYNDEDVKSLLNLSEAIDELWAKQVRLSKEVGDKTQDLLSVYGHEDIENDSHTTIREKDRIYSELYKSEHMKNAGPYARLKFAMDYWCALWFWPIDQADLLPSRSEFLFEMSIILIGTQNAVQYSSKEEQSGQMSLFPTEYDQLAFEFAGISGGTEVDIPKILQNYPRLALAHKIAEQQKFMHWELEFADLFAERGGFDLIIGNPPWILMGWNEQNVLADSNPVFAVKKMTATQTTKYREEVLKTVSVKKSYFNEYESMSGQQKFLNAMQNYKDLVGMKANLYKCFLPQAWQFSGETGVSAFVHPDGVYDDPKGGALRENIYQRLRKHFQFTNEYKLFEDVDHHTSFSLNIYGEASGIRFDTISNLFSVEAIEQCYDKSIAGEIPGIKDENDNWNTHGHPGRVVHVGKEELLLFAKLFDGNDNWKQARLPVIHAQTLMDVLEKFGEQKINLGNLKDDIYITQMWNETGAQNDRMIKRNVRFPDKTINMIYSGPHIGVANPIFKTSRRICNLNSDYDNVDLCNIPNDYLQRVNYSPDCNLSDYIRRVPKTAWNEKNILEYRFFARKMLNISGERTLIGAIVPPQTAHIHGIESIVFKDIQKMVIFTGYAAAIPYDFLIKILGKANLQADNLNPLPYLTGMVEKKVLHRSILLNCLNTYYSELYSELYSNDFSKERWTKSDNRLNNQKFVQLTDKWTWSTPLRTDYERRQALVEIDVLVSMALGMTLDQLKTIYRIQFPVLQQYEADTWYDANGRIVFTNNRSLTNVGFTRTEWENGIKGAPAGKKFYRTITDDTMPGGPVERTIEYVAPFDRCDREKDYETAWEFFEDKYGQGGSDDK